MYELYLRKKLTGFWVNELRSAPRVIIASPYLTAELAPQVFASCNPSHLVVLTKFDLLDFVTGASCLAVVKRLVQDGVEVLALNRLHLKVISTGDFATLGSQNLTRASTRNLEASVVIREPAHICSIAAHLQTLCNSAKAQRITVEHVEAYEKLLFEFQNDWRALSRKIRGEERTAKRETEKKLAEKASQQQRRELANAPLRKALSELKERGELMRDTERVLFGLTDESRRLRIHRPSSKAKSKRVAFQKDADEDSLLEWRDWDGQFTKGKRYPVYERDRGRILWMKLNKGRVSLFTTGVIRGNYKGEFRLEVECEAFGRANFAVRLMTKTNMMILNCRAWFTGADIRGVEILNDNFDECWFLQRFAVASVSEWLVSAVFGEFNYRRGKRNCGDDVQSMFSVDDGTVVLHLVKFEDRPVFTLDLRSARTVELQ